MDVLVSSFLLGFFYSVGLRCLSKSGLVFISFQEYLLSQLFQKTYERVRTKVKKQRRWVRGMSHGAFENIFFNAWSVRITVCRNKLKTFSQFCLKDLGPGAQIRPPGFEGGPLKQHLTSLFSLISSPPPLPRVLLFLFPSRLPFHSPIMLQSSPTRPLEPKTKRGCWLLTPVSQLNEQALL